MDFVLENGFYLWSKSVENFGQPGCFSDPLPSSRTRTTPQNDSQGLPTGGITPNKDLLFWEDPFLFGSFVRLLTYILDWTLNLFFPASPHVKAFACGYMFDVWTAPQEQDSISRLPLQFVFFDQNAIQILICSLPQGDSKCYQNLTCFSPTKACSVLRAPSHGDF